MWQLIVGGNVNFFVVFLPGNLIFSWIWSVFRQRKQSECLQNSVLHQSICCASAEAAHVSPMAQFLPTKSLERTEELSDQGTKGYERQ